MRVIMLFAATLFLAACDPPDDDGDGWYDTEDNLRVTLAVTDVSQGVLTPAVIIDDRIVEGAGVVATDFVEATVRTVGAWQEDVDEVLFKSRIKVDGVPGTFDWTPENREFDVTVGSRVVSLRSTVTRFADPDPGGGGGETEGDAISEADEATLSRMSAGFIGDPERREIVTLAMFTAPKFAMTDRAREAVTSAFADRDVRAVFLDGSTPVDGFQPGQLLFEGNKIPAEGILLNANDIDDERGTHIPAYALNFTHFMVMGQAARGSTGPIWGIANYDGYNLVVTSGLPIGPPDAHDYQAKAIMHELGHNLGLCHPSEHTGNPPPWSPNAAACALLPPPERLPSLSVMGSPAESNPPIGLIVEALARPLDYSSGQWANLRF